MTSLVFEILYQDEHLIAIDKPAGFYVHPPEDRSIKIPDCENGLILLREQCGKWLYPVHRLDRATSGVLIYALSSEAAGKINRAFTDKKIQKRYCAIVRGYTPPEFNVDRPLKRDSSDTLAEAQTNFKTLAKIEFPNAVGKYPTSRYSWIEAQPRTGRYHQIRRHMAGLGHPLVGDTVHGDGPHNRFFRNQIGVPGLLLRAIEITLPHPINGENFTISCESKKSWIEEIKKLHWSFAGSGLDNRSSSIKSALTSSGNEVPLLPVKPA